MKPTHKIYLCNITFNKKASSNDENKLRKTSTLYNKLFNSRYELSHKLYSNFDPNDFSGVVDYIPISKEINISESADILVYLYKQKYILNHLYDKCINIITNFINENNIKSIQLSGEDVERLIKNNIDIVNDITTKVNHKLNITISSKRYSTNGYRLYIQ